MKPEDKYIAPEVLLNESLHLINVLKNQDIYIAMFGGMAVYYLSKDFQDWLIKQGRKYKDVDFVACINDYDKLLYVFKNEGYIVNNEVFQSYKKVELIKDKLNVDIYFNDLEFNQKIKIPKIYFKKQLITLSPDLLLISKLQNINCGNNQFDSIDVIALVNQFDYSNNPIRNNLIHLINNNYFLYKTVIRNLENIAFMIKSEPELLIKVKNLKNKLLNSSKPLIWHIYSRIYLDNIKYNKI